VRRYLPGQLLLQPLVVLPRLLLLLMVRAGWQLLVLLMCLLSRHRLQLLLLPLLLLLLLLLMLPGLLGAAQVLQLPQVLPEAVAGRRAGVAATPALLLQPGAGRAA
jgi:hypothetical protein